MKQLSFTISFMLMMVSMSLTAQNQITVYGSAGKAIQPNQIFLSLTLQETEDGSAKIEMKDLEADLMDVLSKIGVSASNLVLENISAYPSYNSGGTVLVSKIFILELEATKQLVALVDASSDLSVAGLSILYYSHSDWDKYMEDLKVEAIKDAKKQAEVLASASDRKLGKISVIEETSDYKQNKLYSNYDIKGLEDLNSSKSIIRDLGLYYSLKVTFELL